MKIRRTSESLSHQLLLRAGYVRQLAPGVYANLLPGRAFAAERSYRLSAKKWTAIGAQEMRLPVLHPAAAMVASIAQGELRSYRQLPQIWHHIQTRAG